MREERSEKWRPGNQNSENSRLALVEVAFKQVVELKRLEASTAVEIERQKQTGATERTRLVEASRTQRSACAAAVAKRAMEEYNETERQKIAANSQVQQAAIAARVAEAEVQAKTPSRPLSHWLLLWLCLGQTQRARKVGLPVLRVAAFLLVLRGIWSSRFQGTSLSLFQRAWRGLVTSLQRQMPQLLEQQVPRPQRTPNARGRLEPVLLRGSKLTRGSRTCRRCPL